MVLVGLEYSEKTPARSLYGHSSEIVDSYGNFNVPAIAGFDDEASQAWIQNFLQEIKEMGFATASAHSLRGLDPYFQSMSGYLKCHWEQYADGAPISIATPESLSALYAESTRLSGTHMMLDTMLLPTGSPVFRQALEETYERHALAAPSAADGLVSNFCFVRLSEKIKVEGDKNPFETIIFPALLLNRELLSKAAPYGADEALLWLQKAMRFVNHDPLHQLTMGLVSRQITYSDQNYPGQNVQEWEQEIVGYPFEKETLSSYETWAHKVQEHIVLSDRRIRAFGINILTVINDYFDELAGLKERMLADGVTVEDTGEVIDYLGTTLALALLRVYPLNHYVMDICLARMEGLDDEPHLVAEGHVEDHPNGDYIDDAEASAYYCYRYPQPKESDLSLSYTAAKKRNLMSIAPYDIISHAPEITVGSQQECDERVHRSAVKMVCAVAKDMKFIP